MGDLPSFAGIDLAKALTAIGGVLGVGGAAAILAKIMDKLFPSGDARLASGDERRKQNNDQVTKLLNQLEEQREASDQREHDLREAFEQRERELRKALDDMTKARWGAEEHRLQAERRLSQMGLAAEMVRGNVGQPGADLIPRAAPHAGEGIEP